MDLGEERVVDVSRKRKKQRLNDGDRSRFYGSEIRFNSLCLVEIEINTSFWVYRNER